jgi:hypothetical protein
MGAVVMWLYFSIAVDRRNARKENVRAVSWVEIAIVAILSLGAAAVAPAAQRLGIGVALAGIGIAACGDLHHGYLWEEITVPTLFGVLAAGAYSGVAQGAIFGTAFMGAVALAVYFGGQISKKDPGFGDIIPTAIAGTALGPLLGLGSFAVGTALFALVATLLGKRWDIALPFGPAIVATILIGTLGALVIAHVNPQ